MPADAVPGSTISEDSDAGVLLNDDSWTVMPGDRPAVRPARPLVRWHPLVRQPERGGP